MQTQDTHGQDPKETRGPRSWETGGHRTGHSRESLTRSPAASEPGGSPVTHKEEGVGGEEVCECDHHGGRGVGKKAYGARKHRKPPPSP